MKKLGTLLSGEDVVNSGGDHLALHQQVHQVLGETLSKISSKKREFIVQEVDLGRTIGKDICVQTDQNDKIFYAQRPRRDGMTRFVDGRRPEPTTKVSVLLYLDPNTRDYVLITAWVGAMAPKEPWDSLTHLRKEGCQLNFGPTTLFVWSRTWFLGPKQPKSQIIFANINFPKVACSLPWDLFPNHQLHV